MTTEQTTTTPKPKGRPPGFSPAKVESKQLIEEDGEYVVIRIKKKELAKLLLKDLL
jgi:hypothetical protein